MENDETSPTRKTPELKVDGNPHHVRPISTNHTPYTMPERISINLGNSESQINTSERSPANHSNNPTANTSTFMKQTSVECPLEVCKIKNRSSTNFDSGRSAVSTPKVTAPSKSKTPLVTSSSTTVKKRHTSKTTTTQSIEELDRSPTRTRLKPLSPRPSQIQEKTSIGPRGHTMTTISKREDDDCSGGIVRWMEKCVHNKRPLPWSGSRWSESRCHEHSNCGGYGGHTSNNYQAQAPAPLPPRGPKCNGCDKKYCYYPGMKSQNGQEPPPNIPFMFPPNCPDDPQRSTHGQPQRCNIRYGQPIPLHQLQQNYGNRFPSVSEVATPGVKPCNPKQPSDMNINLVSHISGFDPPVTQPLNPHYVGYSQKYPQDVIRSKNTQQ